MQSLNAKALDRSFRIAESSTSQLPKPPSTMSLLPQLLPTPPLFQAARCAMIVAARRRERTNSEEREACTWQISIWEGAPVACQWIQSTHGRESRRLEYDDCVQYMDGYT